MIKRREAMRLLAGAGAAALAGPAGVPRMLAQDPSAEPLLPLFPLGIVLLPGNTTALHIFEPRYREMIQECYQESREFGILLVQGDAIEPVGCTAKVVDMIHRYRDGRFDVLVHGERRFRLGRPGEPALSALTEEDFDSARSFYRGTPAFIQDEAAEQGSENADLITQAIALRARLNALVAADDPESVLLKQKMPPPAEPQLSFHLMNGLPADAIWKQQLLESRVERERLVLVTLHLQQLVQFMEEDPASAGPRRVA